jgi:LysR family glycine cleavage system transcriptional activator
MKLAHLNGLRAFDATLRTGNFRAAARELGVTPAAVGQQVRNLEEYLGRDLFVRAPKGVTPTDDARDIEAELRDGLVALGNVLEKLRSERSHQRLKLTVDAPFFEMWLASRLANFQAENPGVELLAESDNRMVDLLAEDFDFAIRYAPEQPDIYHSVTLFSVGLVPICTADFARRYDLARHPTTLKGVPLYHIKEATEDPNWVDWQGWCDLHGVQPGDMEKGLRFTKISHGLQVAKSGLGLALGGLLEISAALQEGSIILPFDPKFGCPSVFKYRLVSVRGRRQSSAHRQFRDWIQKQAAEFRTETAGLLV